MTNYYTKKEIQDMGFRALGERVLISRDARIFSPRTISIGDNVLIDAFVLLNGDITIGKYVHVGPHSEIFTGKNSNVTIGDYSGISSHVTIYGLSDDFIGPYLNSPTFPVKYRNIIEEPVVLENCVQIGTHCVILPGVRLGTGCSFGSHSLISKSTEPGGVYVGSPCKRIRERDLDALLKRVEELEAEDRRRKGQE